MIFPADYKYVGVADEARPGDPIYFSTRYLIHFADEVVIYEVEQYPGEGFMRRAVSMEPIAGGSEILVYPEKVDTRNRTELIELASSLCEGPVNTVIFKGGDEHVTFVHDLKSGGEVTLRLSPTPKIIGAVRSLHPELKMVGFKAETFLTDEELISRARESMEKNRLDLVVANDVGKGGMGTEENRVLILGREGPRSEVSGKKRAIAKAVIDALAEEFS